METRTGVDPRARVRAWIGLAAVVLTGALTIYAMSIWVARFPLPVAVVIAGGLVAISTGRSRVMTAAGALAAGVLGSLLTEFYAGALKLPQFAYVPGDYAERVLSPDVFHEQVSGIVGGLASTGPVLAIIARALIVGTLVVAASAAVLAITRQGEHAEKRTQRVAVLLLGIVCASFVFTVAEYSAPFRAAIAIKLPADSYSYDSLIYMNTYYEMREGDGYYEGIAQAAAGDSRVIAEGLMEDGEYVGWALGPAFIRQPTAAYLWRLVAPREAGQVIVFGAWVCALLMALVYWGLQPYLGVRALAVPVLLVPGLAALTWGVNVFFPDYWAALAVLAGFALAFREKWMAAGMAFWLACLFREIVGLWLGLLVVLAFVYAWRFRDRAWLRRGTAYGMMLVVFLVLFWLHVQAATPYFGTGTSSMADRMQTASVQPFVVRFVQPAIYELWPYKYHLFRGFAFIGLQFFGFWYALRKRPVVRWTTLAFAGLWVGFTATVGAASPYWGQVYTVMTIVGSGMLLTSLDRFTTAPEAT